MASAPLLFIAGLLTLLQEACFKRKLELPGLISTLSTIFSRTSSSASERDLEAAADEADADAAAAPEPKDAQEQDEEEEAQELPRHVPISSWVSAVALALVIGPVLLFMRWPALTQGAPMPPLEHFFGTLFTVGGTVYGGGQVILPVLMTVCIKPGWISTS